MDRDGFIVSCYEEMLWLPGVFSIACGFHWHSLEGSGLGGYVLPQQVDVPPSGPRLGLSWADNKSLLMVLLWSVVVVRDRGDVAVGCLCSGCRCSWMMIVSLDPVPAFVVGDLLRETKEQEM